MKETLEKIVKSLVENKDQVEISQEDAEMGTTYYIKVDSNDMGRIIGKQGKTISSLRTIFKAAGLKSKQNIRVELIEEEEKETVPEITTAPMVETEPTTETAPITETPQVTEETTELPEAGNIFENSTE